MFPVEYATDRKKNNGEFKSCLFSLCLGLVFPESKPLDMDLVAGGDPGFAPREGMNKVRQSCGGSGGRTYEKVSSYAEYCQWQLGSILDL